MATNRDCWALAFHPQYQENGRFFVNYTDLNGDTVIARFQVSDDPNMVDLSSEVPLLLSISHLQTIMGECSPWTRWISLRRSGRVAPRAIRMATHKIHRDLLGKILRLDVDSQPIRTQFRRIIRLGMRSGHTVCAIHGGSRSTSQQAICTLAMWGRTSGKRSTSARQAPRRRKLRLGSPEGAHDYEGGGDPRA